MHITIPTWSARSSSLKLLELAAALAAKPSPLVNGCTAGMTFLALRGAGSLQSQQPRVLATISVWDGVLATPSDSFLNSEL